MEHKKVTLLEKLKNEVKDSYQEYKHNYERYISFRDLTFNSTLTDAEVSALQAQMKPQLEFNIMKPFLDRQMGEFSLQEPSLKVQTNYPEIIQPEMIEVVQGYIEYNFKHNDRYNVQYDVMRETASGGFSVFKMATAYEHERSFDQIILFNKVFDPTLVGFDPLAKESHKGDGEYCFELYPMKLSTFEREYGKKYTKNMCFSNSFNDFEWSYQDRTGEKIVLLCEFYNKEYEEHDLVLLLDGTTKTGEEYEEFIKNWQEQYPLVPPPGIVGTPRKTTFTKIKRHVLCETGIIKSETTIFKYLPLIFVDGDSSMLRRSLNAAAKQHTAPMLYNALGVQKLKNYSGNTLANELENMRQQRLMMPLESVLPEYINELTKPQIPGVILYSQFYKNDPTKTLSPPTPLPVTPIPQEIIQTFQTCDGLIQNVLGSYDAALGINGNQISGSAMSQGAHISNSVSRPYRVNYLKALNRIAEHYVDLIPKVIKTPRTLPIINKLGQHSQIQVNGVNDIQLSYDPNILKVTIEAGVNFEVQRERSFSMLNNLMQISPSLNELIGNTQAGIEILLDNIDIRNIDRLKEEIPKHLEQKQAQAQQQSQMMQAQIQSQAIPIQVKKEEIELRAMEKQLDNKVKASQVAVEKQKADTERLVALGQLGKQQDEKTLAAMRMQQEQARTAVAAVNAMNNSANLHHAHAVDLLKIHHQNKSNKKENNSQNTKKK